MQLKSTLLFGVLVISGITVSATQPVHKQAGIQQNKLQEQKNSQPNQFNERTKTGFYLHGQQHGPIHHKKRKHYKDESLGSKIKHIFPKHPGGPPPPPGRRLPAPKLGKLPPPPGGKLPPPPKL